MACPGVSDALAAALGIRDLQPLEPSAGDRPGADVAGRGLGRVGDLATATTLGDFVATVGAALPATSWGVRAAGDPHRRVARVAVCGGSGGGLAEVAATSGADVLVTSDLKHHSTSEALADHGIGLVDAAHWATEQPWLAMAARLLVDDLRATGTTVETTISTTQHRPLDHARHGSEDAVKAAPDDQLRLLDLQELDPTLGRLAHRRETLPELGELDVALDPASTPSPTTSSAAETEDSDLGREQARVDADVEMVRGRMSRDQQRLDTGHVGSPRELENLPRRSQSLHRRQSELEDAELEVMEQPRGGPDPAREAAGRAGPSCVARSTTPRPQRDSAYAEIDNESGQTAKLRAEIAADAAGRPGRALREAARVVRRRRRRRTAPRPLRGLPPPAQHH